MMIPSLLQLDGQKVYRDRMREEGWARASETDGLFVTVEVRQILELVRGFKCRVDGCKGHFKLVQASTVAHGGSVKLWFRCSGHGCVRQLIWCGSSCVTLPRRLGEAGEQVVERVGFGKVIAAILSGQLYRDYSRQIAAEGSRPYEPQRFNEIVVWILPYTTSVLNAQVKHGRDAMKKLPPESLGSSKRAVTCADGYWQVRGYTSPNGTATVSDWLTRAVIGYGHCCQRGVDIYDFEMVCSCGACDQGAELSCIGVKQFAGPYKYTSKSMEADKLFDIFNDLRSDAIMIERNVADGDGGSDVVFKLVFPEEDSQHQLCGGHHNRAVISRLMKAAAMKTWPATKVELERAANGTAPMPLTCDATGSPLRCHCSKHKAGCGCIGANFLQRTRLNHTLCMQQAGSDPDKYEELLSQLMAHVEGNCEECSFHPKLICSCELKCSSDNLVCDGKPYEVTYKLTCPFHNGAAKRILTEAAAKKDTVISRDLGKVTSNPSETIGKCLTDLRDKSHVLNAMHYKAKSNLGLMLANQTYMLAHFDPDYHFKLDVMAEAGLEIPVGFRETCHRENTERLKLNEKAKTVESKRHRYNLKAARQARGEEYKKNSKDCRTARVGQYLSGATLDLDDADVEIDDSMVDMDNEVDVPEGLGHEELLVDLQRRTQEQAAHRRKVQVAGVAAINGGSSTAPKTPKGVAGRCTCGATCARSCPCSGASPPVDCTEKCHPTNKKCTNCVAGRSSAAQGGGSCSGSGGVLSIHGSRKPTPLEVRWTKGSVLDMYVTLPPSFSAVALDFEATGGVTYVDEITQGCLSKVSCTNGVTEPAIARTGQDPATHFASYVYTDRPIPEHLEKSIGIFSASKPNSQLRGHRPFAGAGGFGERALSLLAAQPAPIILVGHRLLEYDLPLLLEHFERANVDGYACLLDAGVVGVFDTLRHAKARSWVSMPIDHHGRESYALSPVHNALGFGAIDDAHGDAPLPTFTANLHSKLNALINSPLVARCRGGRRCQPQSLCGLCPRDGLVQCGEHPPGGAARSCSARKLLQRSSSAARDPRGACPRAGLC